MFRHDGWGGKMEGLSRAGRGTGRGQWGEQRYRKRSGWRERGWSRGPSKREDGEQRLGRRAEGGKQGRARAMQDSAVTPKETQLQAVFSYSSFILFKPPGWLYSLVWNPNTDSMHTHTHIYKTRGQSTKHRWGPWLWVGGQQEKPDEGRASP